MEIYSKAYLAGYPAKSVSGATLFIMILVDESGLFVENSWKTQKKKNFHRIVTYHLSEKLFGIEVIR